MSVKVVVYDTKRYDREYLSAEADTHGIEWEYQEFRLSAQTARTAEGAAAVCAFVNDNLDGACLEQLAKQGVKHIALRCAGYNNVDLGAAGRLGMRVTRVPAYSPAAVAEHSVALLMTLNRKIHRAYNRVREQNFSLGGLVGFDLCSKTVGIVGSGRIGRVAARIFRGFGCRVLVYDKYPDTRWAAEIGAEYVDLDKLFRESDVISFYVPLLPDTRFMFNDERLALTKPGVFIVNTSRGKLIDTGALIKGLKSGHIGGVALDVYEEEEGIFFEDLSDAVIHDDELVRLIGFPNVLVTAHQAFLTGEALREIARVTAENVARIAAGGDPLEQTELTSVT